MGEKIYGFREDEARWVKPLLQRQRGQYANPGDPQPQSYAPYAAPITHIVHLDDETADANGFYTGHLPDFDNAQVWIRSRNPGPYYRLRFGYYLGRYSHVELNRAVYDVFPFREEQMTVTTNVCVRKTLGFVTDIEVETRQVTVVEVNGDATCTVSPTNCCPVVNECTAMACALTGIPKTLRVTFTNGNCYSALDGKTFTIKWTDQLAPPCGIWRNLEDFPGGEPVAPCTSELYVSLYLTIDGGGNTLWFLSAQWLNPGGGGGQVTTMALTLNSCSPFQLTADPWPGPGQGAGGDGTNCGCLAAGGPSISAVVTE